MLPAQNAVDKGPLLLVGEILTAEDVVDALFGSLGHAVLRVGLVRLERSGGAPSGAPQPRTLC